MKIKDIENDILKITRWIRKAEESLTTVKIIADSLLQELRKKD